VSYNTPTLASCQAPVLGLFWRRSILLTKLALSFVPLWFFSDCVQQQFVRFQRFFAKRLDEPLCLLTYITCPLSTSQIN